MTAPRRWSFSLRTLFVVVAIVSVVMAADHWRPSRVLSWRHLEATAVINGVYATYRHDGHWPSDTELESLVRNQLPLGWRTGTYGTRPWIVVGGLLHMSISHQFEPPQKGAISRTWVFNDEGHEAKFEADVTYSDVSPQAPTKAPTAPADRP
jgi:hypothetical protein